MRGIFIRRIFRDSPQFSHFPGRKQERRSPRVPLVKGFKFFKSFASTREVHASCRYLIYIGGSQFFSGHFTLSDSYYSKSEYLAFVEEA